MPEFTLSVPFSVGDPVRHVHGICGVVNAITVYVTDNDEWEFRIDVADRSGNVILSECRDTSLTIVPETGKLEWEELADLSKDLGWWLDLPPRSVDLLGARNMIAEAKRTLEDVLARHAKEDARG